MKKQGTISPGESLVDNLFDKQIERLDTQPEDQNPQGQSKCSRFLKSISFGQYKTPLYYRQNETYSSKTGGIISLISATLFMAYSFYLLYLAFEGKERQLDMDLEYLDYYIYGVPSDSVSCDNLGVLGNQQNCAELTIEQFIKAYVDQDPRYCITFNQTYWNQQEGNQCKPLEIYFSVDSNGSYQNVSYTEFSADQNFLQCCSTKLDASDIINKFKLQGLNVSKSALYNKGSIGPLTDEYLARFYVYFFGLDESNTIVINLRNSARFSERGRSTMEVQAPIFSFNSFTRQKLDYISFNQYELGIDKYFYQPDFSEKTLQFISQSSSIYNSDNYYTQLVFDVQAQQITYTLYPTGLLNALAQIGGLLAILKIDIVLNFLHQRCFQKKINEEIAKNQIAPDEEEGKKPLIFQNVYSLENFNLLMQRVKQLEGDVKRLVQDKKDD